MELNLNKYDIIGFDLDGTLYPEIEFIEQVYSEISLFLSEKYHKNYDFIYSFILNKWIEKGSSYPFIFKELEMDLFSDINHSIINECLSIFRNFTPKLKLKKEIELFLDNVKEDNKIFLITDGNFDLQKKKIHILNLYKWFKRENIVINGFFGSNYYKPSTFSLDYIKVLKNERNRNAIVYIGDRKVDEDFSLNAGFDFLRVDSFNEFWNIKN